MSYFFCIRGCFLSCLNIKHFRNNNLKYNKHLKTTCVYICKFTVCLWVQTIVNPAVVIPQNIKCVYSLKVSQLSSLTTEACVWCDSERWSPVLPTVSHVLWGRWMSLQGSLEKRDDRFILRMDSTAQEEPNHPILHSAASEQTVRTISKLRAAAIKKQVFFYCLF